MSISKKGHHATMSQFDADTLFSGNKKCNQLDYILIFLIVLISSYLLYRYWTKYQEKNKEDCDHAS